MQIPSNNPIDSEIIELKNAYCMGDNEALGKLVSIWYKELFFFTYRFVGEEDLSEDIIADTVEKLIGFSLSYRNEKLLNPEIDLKIYIKVILKNKCLDHLKIQKNRTTLLERFKKTLLKFDTNEEKKVNDHEHLLYLLSSLNEKEKKIMLLDIEGYSIKEISNKLGIAKKTVSNILSNSRKKLKLILLKK